MADNEIVELKASLATAMARIASMEGELRSKPKEPAFDVNKLRHQLFSDPLGTLRSMGATEEHIEVARAQLITDKLGDQAPHQMRYLASQGPQVMALQAAQEKIEALSRQVSDFMNASKTTGKQQSFKALTESHKDKYLNLSKALSVDESGIMAELAAFEGTAEEFAKAQETKWAKFLGIVPAADPTTSEKTVDNLDPRLEVVPAPLPGQLNAVKQPVVPVEDKEKQSAWNADQHKKLRDEIVNKVSARIKK